MVRHRNILCVQYCIHSSIYCEIVCHWLGSPKHKLRFLQIEDIDKASQRLKANSQVIALDHKHKAVPRPKRLWKTTWRLRISWEQNLLNFYVYQLGFIVNGQYREYVYILKFYKAKARFQALGNGCHLCQITLWAQNVTSFKRFNRTITLNRN